MAAVAGCNRSTLRATCSHKKARSSAGFPGRPTGTKPVQACNAYCVEQLKLVARLTSPVPLYLA